MRYRPGEVSHYWHMEWAERLVYLADHLGAVCDLTTARRYVSALVITRTALEHHLTDRLVFLATLLTREYEPTTGATREETEAVLEGWKADPDNPTIDWHRVEGQRNYVVVLPGYFLDGEPGTRLSEYYFLTKQYDPFVGYAKHQGALQRNFWSVADYEEMAAESAFWWKKRFNPSSLIRNLLLNELVTQDEAMEIDIHFGFLGAFTHPTGAGLTTLCPNCCFCTSSASPTWNSPH